MKKYLFQNIVEDFPSGKEVKWKNGLAKHENGVKWIKVNDEYWHNICGEDLIYTATIELFPEEE